MDLPLKRMKTHVLLTTGRFVGIRVMVPEFSTLAAIRDGDYCRPWVDLNESLWHNKTMIGQLGVGERNRVEKLTRASSFQLQMSNSYVISANRLAPKPRRLKELKNLANREPFFEPKV